MWGSDDHKDYLSHVVARSFELAGSVQPRRLSHFESALPSAVEALDMDEPIWSAAEPKERATSARMPPSNFRAEPTTRFNAPAEHFDSEGYEVQAVTEARPKKAAQGTLSYQPQQQLQQYQLNRRQGVNAPTTERQERMNEPDEHPQHVHVEGNVAGTLIETETFVEAPRTTNTAAQVSQPRTHVGSEPLALPKAQDEPREAARARATIRMALGMGMLPMQQTHVARNDMEDVSELVDVSELLDGRAIESTTAMQAPITPFVSSADSANPSHNSIRMRRRQAQTLRQPLHPQSIVPRAQSPQTLDGFGAPRPNLQTSDEVTDNTASVMPTIHVTIGRVEVRATAQPPPTRKPSEAKPGPSLDEYLRARNGSGRNAQGGSR